MPKLSTTKFTKKGKGGFAFANYPSCKVYKKSTGSAWKNHLLFGDYIYIRKFDIVNGRVEASCRGSRGWINIKDLQKERIMEVNFVDIGQGDGCHVVTPDDQHIIIDAGRKDNMNRYLTWRFNLYGQSKRPLGFPFKVIISHSDQDHYGGFGHIFSNPRIRISEVYHNGLVERPGRNTLGAVSGKYITGLVKDTKAMMKLLNDKNKRKGSRSTYLKTLYKALRYNKDLDFIMLREKDKFLPGFDNGNKIGRKAFSIPILGPITSVTKKKEALKSINDLGKDKNGHSVILKIVYDKVRVLLGGDVNTEFGKLIYDFYKRRNRLGELTVDAAKACHHGSNHFHYDFVKQTNPLATVISSGDEESYGHPRPDAVGAFGKCGYGDRPLIFSTELARSNREITREKLEGSADDIIKVRELLKELKKLKTVDARKKKQAEIDKLNKAINKCQTKYGMINLRTDGKKMIVAQKLENKSSSSKWDIHMMEYKSSSKRFELIEK